MPVAVRSRVIPANEYRRERWRNGLGWTREIHAAASRAAASPAAADPAAGDSWEWRLSIAEIEHDAPFSSFPGVDRELVLAKVSVDSKTRAEVMQITDIFRAKIVDVQPKSLTIEITGDESKVGKFLDLMKAFGKNS